MARDTNDVIDWAGGGNSWEPPPEPDPPAPEPKRDEPKRDEPKKPLQPTPKPESRGQLGGVGLVCGRFLPLHRGHDYVLEIARRFVEDLRVIVFASPGEPISGATRVRWLRESYPGVTVELVERTSNDPPALAELTRAVSRGPAPRMFFASEPSYEAAARELGATFVPIDPSRTMFPISGTAMRRDVLRHYDQLSSVAKPWFVRRVAIIGAESTGKSTLSARLAEHYHTQFVPEYARTLGESRREVLTPDALSLAARGQLATEDVLARSANRVLVCDTDAHTLVAWHQRLFDIAPSWLTEAATMRDYDLVLLTSLDEPFVGRPDRDQPAQRRAFHTKLLEMHPAAVQLAGDRQARFAQARAAIDSLLARNDFLAARARSLG